MDAELEFAIQPNTTGKQLFDQVGGARHLCVAQKCELYLSFGWTLRPRGRTTVCCPELMRSREECECQWVLGWLWVRPTSVRGGQTVCPLCGSAVWAAFSPQMKRGRLLMSLHTSSKPFRWGLCDQFVSTKSPAQNWKLFSNSCAQLRWVSFFSFNLWTFKSSSAGASIPVTSCLCYLTHTHTHTHTFLRRTVFPCWSDVLSPQWWWLCLVLPMWVKTCLM